MLMMLFPNSVCRFLVIDFLDTNQNQPTARALQLHQKDGKLVVGMVGIVLVFVFCCCRCRFNGS